MSSPNIQCYDDNKGCPPRVWFFDISPRHKVVRGLPWPRSTLWRKKCMENIKLFSNPTLFPVWSQYAIPQVVFNCGVYIDKLFTLLNSLPFSQIFIIFCLPVIPIVFTAPPCHLGDVMTEPYFICHFEYLIQGEAQKWKINARVHKWTYWLVGAPGSSSMESQWARERLLQLYQRLCALYHHKDTLSVDDNKETLPSNPSKMCKGG